VIISRPLRQRAARTRARGWSLHPKILVRLAGVKGHDRQILQRQHRIYYGLFGRVNYVRHRPVAALAHVQHIGVPADGADRVVVERLDDLAQRVRPERRVGVDERDNLRASGSYARSHRRTLALVLREVDHRT
jgi:hypothetical protein